MGSLFGAGCRRLVFGGGVRRSASCASHEVFVNIMPHAVSTKGKHPACRLPMCLQLLDLSTWESGQMPNGTVAAGRITSFMERWVASLGQVADSYCNFEDEQEQCLLKSHSDISTGDSVLDY